MPAGFVDWLTHIPLGALYLLMAAFAAVENVFPPVPADTVVALGSWLAARGQGSAFSAFLATWIGNVAGAAAMYAVGSRHGSAWMRKRFPALADEKNERRLRELHRKYGAGALVLSRFIPGVRALVPPFAGALHLSPVSTILSIAVASGIWYGLVSYLAFRAGADWGALMAMVTHYGRVSAMAAAALVALGAVAWWLRSRRRIRG
ncbi:MAG TPA: VTT domain-containing protein [Gemmatimonadaceae bacterium]|jgi:membrane protein DedA with SNARE-associated domain|nr:VTT domain-containing protein [Gemmatimonadaceae bacterium]